MRINKIKSKLLYQKPFIDIKVTLSETDPIQRKFNHIYIYVVCSKDLPISSISDNGQPRNQTKQASRKTIDQRDKQEEEHSAVQTHHHIQTKPISGVEAPLEQIREDQQHVEDDGLHRVEPNVPAEVRVPHDDEVETDEDEEAIEREALEGLDGGKQRLDEDLEWLVLRDDEFTVLDPIEERVEVTYG